MRTMSSVLVLSSALILAACGGSSGGGASSTDEGSNGGSNDGSNNGSINESLQAQQQALTEIGNVVIAALASGQSAAGSLSSSVASYCDELEANSANLDSSNIDSAKESAQDAWRSAMNAWQELEVMNFGPALEGGNNSPRERIYSWPAVSSCFVDGAVVDYNDDIAGFSIDGQTPRRVGLDALEYLLFTDSLDHTCSTDTSTNSSENGAWNSRTDVSRMLARCAYAEIVSSDLSSQISTLHTEWQDTYLSQLSTAGGSSTTYTSATDALNDISDAMFYLESEVKDLKLAEPTGISASCTDTRCPDRIESRLSDNGLDNIKANLQGFLSLLEAGLDDLLAGVDQASIATLMKADINTAVANIDAFEGSFNESVEGINATDCTNTTSTNRTEPACALHADVKKVTDVLKSDFVTALTLAIPQSAVGDND